MVRLTGNKLTKGRNRFVWLSDSGSRICRVRGCRTVGQPIPAAGTDSRKEKSHRGKLLWLLWRGRYFNPSLRASHLPYNNRKSLNICFNSPLWRITITGSRLIDGKFLRSRLLDTINQLYGLNLSAKNWPIFDESATRIHVKTAEDAIVSQVGRDLFEKFFKGLTAKHWGMDASKLDASVTLRIPVRTSRDDRYFSDRFQGIPKHGYTALFIRMLQQPAISVLLNTDYRSIIKEFKFNG